MKTPEGYEKDDICKFLDSLGARCWYFRVFMAGYGKAGVPDIVGCYMSKWFSIEVKREGKQPTERQWQRMGEISGAVGKVFWGTSSKVIPEFKDWIEE